ncbi:MAG: ChaN family lipoprotein [Microcoleaceae cyanobacterium]
MQSILLMKIGLLSIGAVLIGIFLKPINSVSFVTSNQTTVEISQSKAEFSPDQQVIVDALKQANVVYLGETHNRLDDHQAQFQIIQALHQSNPKLVVAMEMFQRPFQPILDRYLAGEITEQELIEQSQYEQRWGFPWEYYADIVRFAQENNLPLIAANTPTEVTRKVARSGLKSLTDSDQRYIPPVDEVKTDNADYRQMVLDVFQLHAHHGSGQSTGHSQADKSNNAEADPRFENFFAAQVLWDETMADSIVNFLKDNPGYQVVVIVGQGHVVYDYGIPSRVERRLSEQNLTQASVLFQSPDESPTEEPEIADFIWKH